MLKTFQEAVAMHKAGFRKFLDKVAQNPPPLLDAYTEQIDKEVWQEVDCLRCSNCCRNMSPTYTVTDIKRIATHLRMSMPAFKEKWLYKNKKGEWMNRSQPCQFLDLETNYCTIYSVRPEDCAGFPHLAKKKMVEYMH